MQTKDKLNIKDIVDKLKDIEKKSHKSDVSTSIYDNLLYYLESQNLRQNIIKEDNNVFRAFSDALNMGQLKFKPVKEKLVEKMNECDNQLNHICKMYLDIDFEKYLSRLERQSVDPMVELGFLLQLYNKNLRLFYFYEDSSLMEIKLPASSNDAEYVTLFYFKSMFHTIKEMKTETEENKIDLAKFKKSPAKKKPNKSKEYEGTISEDEKLEPSNTMGSNKSKSTIFTSTPEEKAGEKKVKRSIADRKANYKNKDMSLKSGTFIPSKKDK